MRVYCEMSFSDIFDQKSPNLNIIIVLLDILYDEIIIQYLYNFKHVLYFEMKEIDVAIHIVVMQRRVAYAE